MYRYLEYTKKMKRKINFIFIGGKKLGYESLKYLLKKKYKPICVVPNIDDDGFDNVFNKSVLKLAKKNNIKILKLQNLFNFIVKKKFIIDLILCLGSTSILPKNIIDLPKIGSLNIHPSILPKYRGRYSLVHAIFNGEKFTGLTAHWIDKNIDLGQIISQKKIRIKDGDTGGTLYKKFTINAIKEFKSIFHKILKYGKINSYKVKKANKKYKNKHFPNDGNINWKWNGKKIYNFLRSLIHEPFNPPEIKFGSKTYYVVSKELIQTKNILKSPK